MYDITRAKMRVFHAILEHRSVRKAADQLEMSRSLVSRYLTEMEDMIGGRLFDRTATGLMPTDAVPYLLEYARGMEASQEKLLDQMHQLRSLQKGNLLISLSEGLIDTLMEDVLAGFMKKYPGVEVVLNMRATAEIINDVATNEAHIGLAYNPPMTGGIAFCASAVHHIVAAVHPDHPLAQRDDPVPLAEALAYPVGIMPPAYGLGLLIRTIAKAENLNLTPNFSANTLMALRAYAQHTRGVAFITDFSIRKEVAAGQLVGVPLKHPLAENQYARVMVKEGRPLPRAAQEVINSVNAHLSTLTSDRTNDVRGGRGRLRVVETART
ncbi:LysR family transcriptional regulator [Ralstonia solanacearum]|uniref:LysR family transcriptional regulator n=2 Tax=Ralstonia solanacearum TaxID=305 RepID=A0AAW5ZHN5_RALSL|nr:LysR family transcriptional regulator [Ralstonia solanacearum]AST35392.2 LysR family transcriptional regulator [Ralstonia solanacearum]MDB0507850.1 LysR family transcriptional regulator [Ralstonia solanacearum]MDB0512120.1 LysR family transcriptional regulator [Ralstonia solanacearum]MDB0566396.1 LysR family transcriptional regulator [Ralstonia solanacearum]MDB0569527.1 LysR family transcriptional regulator [Ralstonia solanacearum]